ncbi:MarR family transcriptional regulator, partial [Mesorhizobium sp. M00.F.Ca.ET.149.01.1.1]
MDETRVRDVPGEDALDAQIGYNLRRASALALNDFSVEMAEASLRPVTYAMLALIDERPGIRAAELCRLLGMKSANMAPLLAEL